MQDIDQINYIRHQKDFYSHIRKNDRLKAHDISLYQALFQIWNYHHFRRQFSINREEVMLLSGIGSRSTYNSCLKWLHECGYIIYQPPRRPYEPSLISIIPFKKKDTKQLSLFERPKPKNKLRFRFKNGPRIKPGSEPHKEPKNEPYTGPKMGHNYNKQINSQTESKETHTQKKIKSNEFKIQTTIEAAATWFAERGHPAAEARKFFHHYQAINWTLSGQPIHDWQAAAAKWAENIKVAINTPPGKLHTDDNKAYTSPL